MSNTRNDIAKRLGSAQPNARPGAKTLFYSLADWNAKYKRLAREYTEENTGGKGEFYITNQKAMNEWIQEVLDAKKEDDIDIPSWYPAAAADAKKIKWSRPGAKAKFAVIYSDSAPGDVQSSPRQYPRRVEVHFAIGKTDFLYSVKYFENGKLIGVHENLSREKALEDAKSFIRAGHRSYSRPGVKAKFATPEQIKERYKQLRAMPKQRLFDIWTRETLGRIHNADIKEQDKLNMAVDLIRSEYERKDWEAAGFKINSSRPGNRFNNAYPGPRRATSEAARSIAADLEATYGIQAWVEDAIVFVDAKNFERAKQARTEQNKKHYNPRIVLKAVSVRPGAKTKMAEPLPTRPIGSGKNRYLIYHQAVAEEIEQIKQMRNGIIYLREQLSNAKSDMNGAIASFMKVKEFEDEAKAKAQFQNAENEFKQAKEKVQYYLKQVRFSRPGVKVK